MKDSNGTKLTVFVWLSVLLSIFCATARTLAAIVDLFAPLLFFVLINDIIFVFSENIIDFLAYFIFL